MRQSFTSSLSDIDAETMDRTQLQARLDAIKVKIRDKYGLPITEDDIFKSGSANGDAGDPKLTIDEIGDSIVVSENKKWELPYFGQGIIPHTGKSLSPQQRKVVADFIGTNSHALDLSGRFLQDGCLEPPEPYDHEDEDHDYLSGRLLPSLKAARDAVRLLELAVYNDSENERVSKAIERIETIYGICSIRNPFLISFLLTSAMEEHALRAIEYLLAHHHIEAPELETLRKIVLKRSNHHAAQWAAATEVVFIEQSGETNGARGTVDIIESRMPMLRRFRIITEPYSRLRWKKIVSSNLDIRALCVIYRAASDFIESTHLTAREQVAAMRRYEIGPYPRSLDELAIYFTLMPIPIYQSLAEVNGYLGIRRTAILMSIAIERFRADVGSLPAMLDELSPDYLPQSPTDPYTGEAMKYTQLSDGYVVYSPLAGSSKEAIKSLQSIRNPRSLFGALIRRWRVT